MSPRSRACLLSLTLAVGAWSPGTASAVELAPSGSAYLSWSFGAEHGLGWGVELSSMALLQGSWDCANLDAMPIGVGPSVQLGFRGLHAPRLVVAAAAGANPGWQGSSTFMGIQGEAGLALPLGKTGDLGFHGGVVASGIFSHAFVRTDPGLGESLSVGLGPRVPGPFNLPGFCAYV